MFWILDRESARGDVKSREQEDQELHCLTSEFAGNGESRNQSRFI